MAKESITNDELIQKISEIAENMPKVYEAIQESVTPKVINSINLLASKWNGSSNIYSQVITIDGVTKNSRIDLNPTVEQLDMFYRDDIMFTTENNNGIVTILCTGRKPKIDYVVQVTITEVIHDDDGKIVGNIITSPNMVGQSTPESGEIFNDYNNNQAIGEFSTTKGTRNLAGSKAFSILSVGSKNLCPLPEEGSISSHVSINNTNNDTGMFDIKFYHDAPYDNLPILSTSFIATSQYYTMSGNLGLEIFINSLPAGYITPGAGTVIDITHYEGKVDDTITIKLCTSNNAIDIPIVEQTDCWIQIEEGNKATDFQPYSTKSYLLDSAEGLEVGDVYSCRIYENFDYYGSITAINGNRVMVDNFAYPIDDSYALTIKDRWIFFIPDKPLIGTRNIGTGADAGGYDSKSQNDGTFTRGDNNKATGRWSGAIGKGNIAGGYASFVSGRYNNVYSIGGVAFGRDNTLFNKAFTTLVTGERNTVKSSASIVGGENNDVGSGGSSLIIGSTHKIAGSYHSVSGRNNITDKFDDGNCSLSGINMHGEGLTAYLNNQTVLGQYNNPTRYSNFDPILVFGYGTKANPKDILALSRKLQSLWISNNVLVGGSKPDHSDAKKLATQEYADSKMGFGTTEQFNALDTSKLPVGYVFFIIE